MPAIGFGSSLLAAMDRNAFMAWTGAAVGATGLIVQGILSWYRQAREAKRREDEADRASNVDLFRNRETTRLLKQVQHDIDARISKSERDILELVERLNDMRCIFPNADGSPFCIGKEKPPCST